MAGALTVRELAAQSGVAVSAIYFYESRGLIGGRRTAGNRRRYPRGVLKRVLMIRSAQGAGIPLGVVADILRQYPDKEMPGEDEWQRLRERWTSELDNRIGQLARLRDQLSYCIGCGCLLMEACPLVAPEPGREQL